MNYLNDRIEKIRQTISGKADALLVTDDVTRQYVFGFRSSAGFGYVSAEKCMLFLDFRYSEKARIAQSQGKISADVTIVEQNLRRGEILSKIMREDGAKTLLFEDKRMTCAEFYGLKKDVEAFADLIAANDCIDSLRAVKDNYELERIVEAQRITDAAFSHIISFIKKGMTESEVALELEFFMKKHGADSLAFDTICVSGCKSSMPHGEPDKSVISDGFLTMDFGARFDGYCSDMTRTVCIGKPTSEMMDVYETVLDAQNAAFSAITSGVQGSVVDKAARDVIYSNGYEGCFGHSTGHSLGLEIHESPNFSPRETDIIPAGAVLSVEPGIYLEGKFGVRTEDIVFLTENGYKNLTNSTKEIIIIQ